MGWKCFKEEYTIEPLQMVLLLFTWEADLIEILTANRSISVRGVIWVELPPQWLRITVDMFLWRSAVNLREENSPRCYKKDSTPQPPTDDQRPDRPTDRHLNWRKAFIINLLPVCFFALLDPPTIQVVDRQKKSHIQQKTLYAIVKPRCPLLFDSHRCKWLIYCSPTFS